MKDAIVIHVLFFFDCFLAFLVIKTGAELFESD